MLKTFFFPSARRRPVARRSYSKPARRGNHVGRIEPSFVLQAAGSENGARAQRQVGNNWNDNKNNNLIRTRYLQRHGSLWRYPREYACASEHTFAPKPISDYFFWFLGIYIPFSIFNNKAKKKSFLDLIRPKYKYSWY